MKRNVFVLTLALVMAFGLTALVSADSEVPVYVKIGKFASIDVGPAEPLKVEISRPNELFESNVTKFTVRSNAGVNIHFQAVLTSALGLQAADFIEPLILVGGNQTNTTNVGPGINEVSFSIKTGIRGETEWWTATPDQEALAGHIVLTVTGF